VCQRGKEVWKLATKKRTLTQKRGGFSVRGNIISDPDKCETTKKPSEANDLLWRGGIDDETGAWYGGGKEEIVVALFC